VRVDKPLPADSDRGIVRMDRFLRQALKAHLNEVIEVEPPDPAETEGPAIAVAYASAQLDARLVSPTGQSPFERIRSLLDEVDQTRQAEAERTRAAGRAGTPGHA